MKKLISKFDIKIAVGVQANSFISEAKTKAVLISFLNNSIRRDVGGTPTSSVFHPDF